MIAAHLHPHRSPPARLRVPTLATALGVACLALHDRRLPAVVVPPRARVWVGQLQAGGTLAPAWGVQAAALRAEGSTEVSADTIKTLQGILRKATEARWFWRKHCSEQEVDFLMPLNKAPVNIVQEFLAQYQSGAFEQPEFSSPELVDRYDAKKVDDPSVAWQWHQYAREKAYGITNPLKVPARILQAFLEEHETGALEKLPMASQSMADEVNAFQKVDGGNQWYLYCKKLGTSFLDPAFMPHDIVQRFLEDHREPLPREGVAAKASASEADPWEA